MLKVCIFVSFLCLAKGLDIGNVVEIFGNKHCIEASLVTLNADGNVKNMVVEKPEQVSIQAIVNSTKETTEKALTSQLNELAQYNEITQEFELISEEGPAHSKTFTIELRLGEEVYKGTGSSLRKAKNDAASQALEDTLYKHPPVKLAEPPQILTPTVVLNNVALRLGVAVKYELLTGKEGTDVTNYESHSNLEAYGKQKKSYLQKLNSSKPFLRVPTEDPQISGPFDVKVKIDEFEFIGFGHTIQSAKHDAAVKALKAMEKEALLKDNECAKDESTELCKQKKEALKSPISRIYEAGQIRKMPVDFNIVEESGKSHNKLFVTECTLGEFRTRGEGKSKKESKNAAAELMLDNFDKLPEFYNGKAIANSLTGKKKRNKKRKNNIIRGNVKVLSAEVADMISSFLTLSGDSVAKKSNTDSKKAHSREPQKSSNKDKLLEASNLLNFEVQFYDLGHEGGHHFTMLSLGVNPLHICLGKAPTQKESHESAAVHGLKFLQKIDFLDKKDWEMISGQDSGFFSDISLSKEDDERPDVFEDSK